MVTISLVLVVLVNQVNSQTSLTTLNIGSEVNRLSERPGLSAIFPTQIQQIQTTSETRPAVSAGNNLNVVGGPVPTSLDVPEQNFQPISTIYSMKNKKTYDKYAREGNGEFLSDESVRENYGKDLPEKEANRDTMKAERLVWDNCLETNFKDTPQNIVKPQDVQNDNHDYRYHGNKEIGSIWRKRDAGNLNLNSTAGKAWLEKYNNLLNAKTEERRQQKPEPTFKKTTSVATTAAPLTTVQIIPITREVFNEPMDSFNTTQNAVTESDIVASYTEDWFEEKDRSKIRFGSLPQKETYLIPSLKLEEEFHPFGFMSDFFYLIYPFDFPVGKQKLY